MNSLRPALSRREILLSAAVAPLAGAAARTITVHAFDPMGKPAGARQLESLLLINEDSRPFELLPKLTGEGVATISLPPGNFQLMMRLPVAGFGEVYLYADDVRGPEALLNYEFARSRAALVRRYVKAAQSAGVSFSAGLLKRLETGEEALRRAAAANEVAERVRHSNDSLAETMWAGEMAALERARRRIERQGPRPGFLFGAAAFGLARSAEYAERYTALLNYGTVPFYRATTEPVEGKVNYKQVDGILAQPAGASLMWKGHPLVWLNRASVPEFLKQKSWPELQASWRDYILRSVSRYRTRIHAWDVINEAHDWGNLLRLAPEQLVELTRLAAETTRQADPTAFRVVNNCTLWGEYVARRLYTGGTLDRPCRTVLEYLRAVRDARIDYEAIGLQIYCPGRDMLEIERHIERFFEFGKPIHITELGIPSADSPDTRLSFEERGSRIPYPIDAVWHGTEWSEQIQADWVEQFYTLCYSMPQVDAISWWDFTDPGYMPNGGLLTRDLRPKQSYERLMKLLAGWRG